MSQDELEERVSTKQGRIAEIAKKYSDKLMLSIAHNIDLEWLCRRSRKNRLEWVRFSDLLNHYPLPVPKIYHSLWGKALS